MKIVHLKRGKSRPIQSGHAWVFAGSIDRVTGDDAGDVVEVLGDRGDRLGIGLWSEHSSIRVRMLGNGHHFDDGAVALRIEQALERRRRLGIDKHTAVFRAVNSEGDALPGLSVDVFGDSLVTFLCSTRPMFDRREVIAAGLRAVFPGAHVLERPAPSAIGRLEGFEPAEAWHTEPIEAPFEVTEYGVKYLIDPTAMQKTGHYADMREQRAWVGALSEGRRVLDAYSYTGGFALHAARGGATRVVAVDSSGPAIEGVRANALANGFAVEAHASDTGDYLRSAYDRGERFDIVVLDPPKLAPRKQHVAKALKVYEAIAVQAARLVDAGGLLCIGSCSEAIGPDELARVFCAVTERLGRPTRVMHTGGQPADHPYPAAMPESRYLTFVACALD